MDRARRNMDALSVHYYTIATGNWGNKSSATGFDESLYFSGLKQAMRMDELLTKHSAIMDKHDPRKNVPLLVDEWGIWTDVEPGTEPGFLYQQNSMRDALIAAISFNIFHEHSERVEMANIAQTVNVLQAMLLTNDEQIIKTPTYHVFNMYKSHQDATFIPSTIKSEEYKMGDQSFPSVTATASKSKEGKVNISLSNLNPNKPIEMDVDLTDGQLKNVTVASILTAPAFNSINDFNNPETVKPASFSDYSISNGKLKVKLPPHSLVSIEIQ